MPCSVVLLALDYTYVSESDSRSGAAMGEEDIETVKSEFRLEMEYLFCTALISR